MLFYLLHEICFRFDTRYIHTLQVNGRLRNGLPFILYACAAGIAAGLSCFLPETNNRKLLEQIKDADKENNLHM